MQLARGVVLLSAAFLLGGVSAPGQALGATIQEAADSTRSVAPLPVRSTPSGRYVAPVQEIRGRRPQRSEILDRRSGFASVLDQSSWSAGLVNSAEVLAKAVGVNVRETGGIGSYSSMSIRGSSSTQVPIYLDGVPLGGPGQATVNLASIDPYSLERIEVYRGAAPLTLGGTSLGGAVHLYSAAGKQPLRSQVAAGSFASLAGEVGGGWDLGSWTVGLRARAQRSEGDWSYFDDRGTPYNPDDDVVRPRTNNQTLGAGGLLSASRSVGSWKLQLSQLVDYREHGIPGYRTVRSDDASTASATHHLRVAVDRDARSRSPLRRLEFQHRLDRQRFRDLDGDLRLGRMDREDLARQLGLVAQGALPFTGPQGWRAELRWSRLRSKDQAGNIEAEGAPQTRWTAAVALEPFLRFAGDRLLVQPGLRIEWHRSAFHGTPPFSVLPLGDVQRAETLSKTAQLGARLSLTRELDLKSNIGIYQRVPTLLELFGHRGTVVGNPELRPEEGTNRDVGLVWSRPLEGRRIMLSLFQNDAFDLITFEPVNPAVSKAFNVGRAEIEGLELELDMGRFGPLGFDLGFNRLSAIDRSGRRVADGKQLPGRPRTTLQSNLHLGIGPVRARLSLTAMGENYVETGERTPIPSRALLGLGARWDLGAVRLDGRVDNVGDREVFDLWGYPLPGRRFVFAVSYGGIDHAP